MSPVELERRLHALERKNRLLTLACGASLVVPLFAILGWQNASDTARVRRLEVVDEHGVPLVTLGPSRDGKGGSILLRDVQGEKRAWWEAGPETSQLSMNSAKADGTNDTTLGLQVSPKSARLAIISKNGAVLSANMSGDNPQLELYNTKGGTVFAAPLRPRGE